MHRVALLIDEASVGGGQQHVLWLAEHLDRRIFEPVVICEAKGYLVDELKERKIPVYAVQMSNRPGPGPIVSCARMLRHVKPSIVHTHGGTAGVVGRVAAALAGIGNIVHTHHGLHYLHLTDTRRSVYRLIDRVLLRWTDRVICVAQSDFDLGCKWGVVKPEKSEVIRNGIDVDRFAASDGDKAGEWSERLVLGTIGRLHEQKGYPYLIQAVARVARQFPDVVLWIVGEGEMRNVIEEEIKRVGVQNHVQLLGARTDVPHVLSGMDIFVLGSLWEGMPLVLLEAMAAGKPIVSTAVDGVAEVIMDGIEGLLVPPRDPTRLAEAIIRVSSDRNLAQTLGRNAREKVKQQYNLETMVSRTEEIYSSLLARRTAARE